MESTLTSFCSKVQFDLRVPVLQLQSSSLWQRHIIKEKAGRQWKSCGLGATLKELKEEEVQIFLTRTYEDPLDTFKVLVTSRLRDRRSGVLRTQVPTYRLTHWFSRFSMRQITWSLVKSDAGLAPAFLTLDSSRIGHESAFLTSTQAGLRLVWGLH